MGLDWTSRTNTSGFTGRSLRVAVTVTATLGFSLFGYDQGLMSGLITGPQFNYEFPATKDHAVNQGAVTACYEIGCFFGALFAMLRGDKIGRRPLIILGAFIIIIGTIISVTPYRHAWGTGQFVIGRVVTGLGNGLNTATIPVWQSEMSKPEKRGMLVNLEGSVIAIGTFVAYWVDFGMSYVDDSSQWRFPVAFQIFFAVFVMIFALHLPESPRWLLGKGRRDEAVYILAALNGVGMDDVGVQEEATAIQDGVEKVSRNQASLKDVFTGGKTQHFRRMLIGSSTQFFQQFTGCNAAIYYSTVLFEQTINLEKRLALILGGVFATIYALATIPSFFLIERLGRRNLFLVGAIGQGCSFMITFGCLVKDTKENAKGAAVGLFLFIIFFAFTILPLPWVYPPEINPLRTRTVASAISTCTNWLTNFAVVMFTPIFIKDAGWGCYLFFACMNFLFVPIIFFYYPETAGRSLEEVDILFAKAHVEKQFVWRVAQTMPRMNHREVEKAAIELGLFDEIEFENDGFDDKASADIPDAAEKEGTSGSDTPSSQDNNNGLLSKKGDDNA
ncbi:Sugar transporter [Wickerhamomyces ciferrii]|uniref:Sugar transporter n=1 Tax=Wickerhamomyces ciferrii (strain ATCC 14091 / BCRC 22168 / CBS 111 / JCM 3599 / NBRC 0793 / NRRL Y-1031 F-60-10) TaxID=1206466 RepID=K0KK71_WICCF|nr:Sugar transporter [Wickerhamomyces ciferrii]CCH43321.1 Sugar transporter [Wickerhamomyces ciferrii]